MSANMHSLPESFPQEQVEILFSEISLALHWGRPSILVAVCSTAALRRQAQTGLTEKLRAAGQKVLALAVNDRDYDVPLALVQHPEREQAVFYVSGLNRGGGREKHNAFTALNIRRELLVDRPTRVVFWLTPAEAKSLPRLAPDFWAFRHAVVEI